MTKYGSTDEMEKMAYGGTKTATPAVAVSVQNTITTLMNGIMNRTEDFTTVPTWVNDVANLIGSEILRNRGKRTELSLVTIREELEVLCKSHMDQSPTTQSRWGNVYYT